LKLTSTTSTGQEPAELEEILQITKEELRIQFDLFLLQLQITFRLGLGERLICKAK